MRSAFLGVSMPSSAAGTNARWGMQLWHALAACRCSWKGAAPLQHHPFHLSAFLVPFSLSFLSLANYLTFLCLIVKSE